MLDHARDIVSFDLFLVMDKFTAADVLREVSVYDTISKGGGYSMKVRRLGEFHPVMSKSQDPEGQDIDDPLYGNVGGSEEVVGVSELSMMQHGWVIDAAVVVVEIIKCTQVQWGAFWQL